MKVTLKLQGLPALLAILAILFAGKLTAQPPGNITMTEADAERSGPIDDIMEKRTGAEKRVLPYDHLREADVFWEKRIWRVIDIREKMNLPFANEERPFFTILQEAAESGELTVYSTENDRFTNRLTPEEVAAMGGTIDTVITFNPLTYVEEPQEVRNDLNPEDVKRYRLKEVWFMDKKSSTLQVRILGIAPLIDVKDDNGNFKYEQPMFWVYYPDAREMLARERVFNAGNDAAPMSWEDMFESRFFSSYIYKESNVHDRRLQDYLSGMDLLLEADRIKQEIFNREHDQWSY